MACDCEKPIQDEPRLILPPWLDPGFILSTCQMVYTHVNAVALADQLLVKANPLRVMLGILSAVNPGPAFIFAPTSDTVGTGYTLTASTPEHWFYPMKHGPMAMYEWRYSATGAFNIGVYEVVLY